VVDHLQCVPFREQWYPDLTGLDHAVHAQSREGSAKDGIQRVISVLGICKDVAYNVLINHFPPSPGVLGEVDILSFDPDYGTHVK
jgi:hypothetical protein